MLERLELVACIDKVKDTFPALDEMIRRRHQIVHRADRVKSPDSNNRTPECIQAVEVRRWLDATVRLTVVATSYIAARAVAAELKSQQWPGARR